MEFHNIMHSDCLAYDYCIYEIFSLLSIFVVKLQHLYYLASANKGIPN